MNADVWRCGICGFEAATHDEIIPCVRSHSRADMLYVYNTGRYVARVAQLRLL